MNDKLPPTYSFWPILLAVGIVLLPIGVVASVWEISVVGVILVFTCIMGWAWQNRSEPREEEDE